MTGRAPRPPARKPPAKGRARRRSGRGVLLVVSLMLVGSGVIRFADGTGQVLAEESSAPAPDRPAAPAEDTQTVAYSDPDIAEIIAALDKREERLDLREAALADRLAALSLAETEVRSRLAELAEAEARLERLVAISETASEQDLARMTAVFESMKPKQAAPLFQEMAPEFAAGFIARMRHDVSAAILAGMEPETAYLITTIVSGRNANAPSE